jgi:hypothetical protein
MVRMKMAVMGEGCTIGGGVESRPPHLSPAPEYLRLGCGSNMKVLSELQVERGLQMDTLSADAIDPHS